jgi:hypothetical protein
MVDTARWINLCRMDVDVEACEVCPESQGGDEGIAAALWLMSSLSVLVLLYYEHHPKSGFNNNDEVLQASSSSSKQDNSSNGPPLCPEIIRVGRCQSSHPHPSLTLSKVSKRTKQR